MTPFQMPIGSWSWLVAESTMERLGWVLLHTLWQFLFIAVLALTLLRLLKRSSASLRYAILVCSLAGCVMAPVVTWFSLQADTVRAVTVVQTKAIEPVPLESMPSQPGSNNETVIASDGPGVAADLAAVNEQPLVEGSQSVAESSNWWMNARDDLRPWLMTVVTVWILGVMICSVRPLLSWIAIRRWRRIGTSPISQEVTAMMRRLSERLGVRRKVEILKSQLVYVPLVFGYIRPVILLPASLLTNLPTSQLEAIIAHELAHVRRHDFLVNFIQTIIETLFFYHPAIWWLSHRVRIERENCCDDLVVSVLGNRVEYGKALLAVEESPGFARSLALGARDGSLLARVQRLAGLEAARRGPIASVAAMIASTLLIAGTAFMIGNLLLAASDDNETQFGKESNGLQIRLIPLAPEISDDSPDLQRTASSFKRSEEMTFAVQMKNVSRQPISLAGIRYGEGYAPETTGKLNTAMLAPHWFEFEFTDSEGKRLPRTPHREFYKGWYSADNCSVHVLAPGESLIEVLRPAKFMELMNYDLFRGKYRVQVHYRGPNDSLREFVRKHWPDKPILNAWPHQATSNVSDFAIEEASNRIKPEDLIWGKPVEGLQAALEYRLPDDAKGNPLVAPGVSVGSKIGITFHLRNVSDKPLTFVSETARQGDPIHVTDESGEEVEVKDVFYTGLPIDVAWKLVPGEVAQMNVLSPGILSLENPGQYKVRYTIRFNSRIQKDEAGNVIFPPPGDYDKEVDTGETPLFLHEAKSDISANKSSEDPFIAKFPNVIRVEFVGLSRGVGDIRAADKWWRPDGLPLQRAPEYRGASGVLKDGEIESEDPDVRTVIHVHGIGDMNAVTATAAIQTADSMKDNSGGQYVAHYGYTDAPARTRTFEVGVATEAISPKRWLDRDGKRIESKLEPGNFPAKDLIAEDITIEKVGPESWGKGATSKGGMKDPVGPGDQKMGSLSGTTQVTIRFPLAWRNVDLRLFAIDKSGNSHGVDMTVTLDPNDKNANYKRLAKTFPVDYSEVDHFEYQFRVYRHWAIFENVSLLKGTLTEVVMKSETIPKTQSEDVSEKASSATSTETDIEKNVLDILRTPFIDDPEKGTWQLGAHDIDVHWKLRELPQRVEVIKMLFKVVDRSVPSSMHERLLAMEFLGGADPKNLVPRLNKEIENALANQAKPFTAYHEIEILGRMGEHARSSLPMLIKLLDSSDRVAYDAAINALIIIGARSTDVMNEFAKHTDDPVTVYQLGRYGSMAKVHGPLFVQLLESPSNEIHNYAALALVKTGFDETRGFNVLIADVAAGKSVDRCRAAIAIAALGSQAKEMIPRLRPFENDPDPQVAKAVREAIVRIEKDERIFTHAEEAAKREKAYEAFAALNPQMQFELRIVGGEEQTPLAGIEIIATEGYGDSQKTFGPFRTDANGTTVCKLPQGFYTLHLKSEKEFPFLPYEKFWTELPPPGMQSLNLRVTGIGVEKWLGGEVRESGVEPAKSSTEGTRITFKLLKPIELVLRAVDKETGRGLSGAYFYLESAGAEEWAHPIDGANLGAAHYRDGEHKFDSGKYQTDADGTFKRFISDGYLRRSGDSEWGPKFGVWKAPEGYELVEPKGEISIDFPVDNSPSIEQVFHFRRAK